MAIRVQRDREVTQIQSQIHILRKELEDKENLEKQLNERKNQIKIDHERSELKRIKTNKNYILDKIKKQETSIIKIREADEIRRLEKEKEILTEKWKEVQLEEGRRKQLELSERESSLRLEQERINLESLEMSRLKRETDDLKTLLEHKSNQEELLAKRISHEREAELAAENIRRMKMEEKLKESDRLGGVIKTTYRNSNGFRKNKVAGLHGNGNTNIKKTFQTNTPIIEDGYLSDTDGFGDVDHIFNEPIFQREIDPRLVANSHSKSKVDPNDYDLDKVDYTESAISEIKSTKSIRQGSIAPSMNKSSVTTSVQSGNHHDNNNSLEYSTIINKLMKDMTSKQPKSKKQSEQLKVMLEACQMMSTIQNDSVQEDRELQEEINNGETPGIDLDLNTPTKNEDMLPSEIMGTSELDSEIFEIHKQMSDIKGILKDT